MSVCFMFVCLSMRALWLQYSLRKEGLRFSAPLAVASTRVQGWGGRSAEGGGVSPLSACLTEANWRHLIAEGNRLERRESNIGLRCPKVCNNIGGIFPLTSHPTKILVGMCPRHPRRRWRQCPLGINFYSDMLFVNVSKTFKTSAYFFVLYSLRMSGSLRNTG